MKYFFSCLMFVVAVLATSAQTFNLSLNPKLDVSTNLIKGQTFGTWVRFNNESTQAVDEITFSWYVSTDSAFGGDLLIDQWTTDPDDSYLAAGSSASIGTSFAMIPENYSTGCDFFIIMKASLSSSYTETELDDNYSFSKVCIRNKAADFTASISVPMQYNLVKDSLAVFSCTFKNIGELSVSDSVDYQIVVCADPDFLTDTVTVINSKFAALLSKESVQMSDTVLIKEYEEKPFYVQLTADPNNKVTEILNDNNSATASFEVVRAECPAVSVPWSYGFEDGELPTCWSKEYVTGTSATSWVVSSASPSEGRYSALFKDASSATDKEKLISPVLDLGGTENIMLSFWHWQAGSYDYTDQLSVYYRTSETEPWVLLKKYIEDIDDYRFDTLRLPELTSTYQIAFEGMARNKWGVYLDDISVYQGDPISEINFVLTDGNQAVEGAEIRFDGKIAYTDAEGKARFEAERGTFGYAILADSLVTIGDSLQVDQFVETVEIEMQPIKCVIDTFRWEYGFEEFGKLPECWQTEFVSGSNSMHWTVQEPSSNTGDYCIRYGLFHYETDVEKLILPSFDFSDYSRMTLRFSHKQEEAMSDNNILRVYYRTSETEEWVLLKAYTNNVEDYARRRLSLPDLSPTYQIAFEGEGGDGYPIYLDDIEIAETNEIGLYKVTLYDKFTAAPISGGVMTIDGYDYVTGEDGSFRFDLPIGKYSYRIWAPEMEVIEDEFEIYSANGTDYRFFLDKRSCVISTFPSKYGFEEGGVLWNCWHSESVTGGIDAQWAVSTDAFGGSYSVSLIDSAETGDVVKLISPVYDLSALDKVKISFTHKQPASSAGQDQLRVYYRISETEEWVLLKEYTEEIAEYVNDSIDVTALSATAQFAFEGSFNGGEGVFVDDFTVFEVWPEVTINLISDGQPVSGLEVIIDSVSYISDANGMIALSIKKGEYDCKLNSVEWKGDTAIVVDDEKERFQFELSPLNCNVSEFPWAYGAEDDELFSKCWTVEYVSGSSGAEWGLTDTEKSEGQSSFLIKDETTSFDLSMLVSPVFEFDQSEKMLLSFSHKQALYSAYYDYLKVYYRTSETDSWHLIEQFTDVAAEFITDTLALPGLSSTYQIAFEGTARRGAGLFLDDIRVFEKPKQELKLLVREGDAPVSGKTVLIAGNEYVTDDNGLLSLNVYSGEYLYAVAPGSLNEFTGAFVVDESTQQIDINIETDECLVNTFPWSYGFEDENAFSSCWSNEYVIGNYDWEIGYDALNGMNSGGFTWGMDGSVTKLVSPVFDFSDYYNAQLNFYYLLYEPFGGGQDELRVYYRTSEASGWVLLAEYTDFVYSYEEAELNLPEISATYQLAFEGAYNGGIGVNIDDLTITANLGVIKKTVNVEFTSDGKPAENASLFVDGAKYSAADGTLALQLYDGIYSFTAEAQFMENRKGLFEITKNGQTVIVEMQAKGTGEKQTVEFVLTDGVDPLAGAVLHIDNVEYTADADGKLSVALYAGEYAYSATDQSLGTDRGTVRVDATATSLTIPIRSLYERCLVKGLPWQYGFEENGSLSECWGNEILTSVSDLAWEVVPESSAEGDFCVRMKDETLRDNQAMLISPVIDFTGQAEAILSFMHKQSKQGSLHDELSVYYRTSESEEWVLLREYISNKTNFVTDTLHLPHLTSSYQLGFKGTAGAGSGVYLDDIMVYSPEPQTYNVNFTVTNGFDAVEGATVAVETYTATTDVAGLAMLEFPAGGYDFTVTIDGFDEYSGFFDVLDAEVFVDVVLTATELDTVFTTITETACGAYDFAGELIAQSGVYADTLQTADGTDSVITVILTVYPEVTINLTDTITEGEEYSFGSQTLSDEGNYTETFKTVHGCDSVVELNLIVELLPVITDLEETACRNYEFGGKVISQSGSYSDTLLAANGADSIVNLRLTVNPVYNLTYDKAIREGESYVFGTRGLIETGTYTELFSTVKGCDSLVTINLEVFEQNVTLVEERACGSFEFAGDVLTESGRYSDTLTGVDGSDSIVVLMLTVNPVYEIETEASITEGEELVFGNQSLTEAGTYSETFQSVNGCDSIVSLVLSVNLLPKETELTETACGSFEFSGTVLTESGEYRETYTASNGADSIVHLDLTVYPVYEIETEASITEGEELVFGSQSLTEAGTYTETFQSVNGCDSVVSLVLLVNPLAKETELTEAACGSYEFGGTVLTESGEYRETFTASNGADSIVHLDLSIYPVYEVETEMSISEGEELVFGSQSLTEAGTYTETFQSVNGCDSIVSLVLLVNPLAKETELTEAACGSYEFGGTVLTESGEYRETYTASNGADSIVHLDLTVYPVYKVETESTITEGEELVFGSQSLTEAGTYTETFQSVNGCDSVVSLVLLVNPLAKETELTETACGSFEFGGTVLTESGEYRETFTASNGVDSIVHLDLTVYPVYEIETESTITEGEDLVFGSQLLTDAGTYIETFQSVNGCDSIVSLVLSIDLLPKETELAETACGSFEFGGTVLTESGEYRKTYTASNGADSVVHLDLTVYPVYEIETESTITKGEELVFGSQLLTDAGSYTEIFKTENGCDSVVTLELTVNKKNIEIVTTQDTYYVKEFARAGTVVAEIEVANSGDEGYNFSLTGDTRYFDISSDGVITVGSSVEINADVKNSFSLTVWVGNGSGGDSFTLTIHVDDGTTATSEAESLIVIYPTAVEEKLFIEAGRAEGRFEIFTESGLPVLAGMLRGLARVDLTDVPSGVYVVLVHLPDAITHQKIIVR